MKNLKLILALAVCWSGFVIPTSAQVLCIYCYDQNDSISQNVNNMILNGGFENTNCVSNSYSSCFCPNSNYYSCTLPNWICTGGGSASYPSIDDNTFTVTADGTNIITCEEKNLAGTVIMHPNYILFIYCNHYPV